MFPLEDHYLRRKYEPDDPEAAVEAVDGLLEEPAQMETVLDAAGPYWTYALLEDGQWKERNDGRETFQIDRENVETITDRLDRYTATEHGTLRTAAGYAAKPFKAAMKPFSAVFLDAPYRVGRATADYDTPVSREPGEEPGNPAMRGANHLKTASTASILGAVYADIGLQNPVLAAPLWGAALGTMAAEPGFKGRAAAQWEEHVETYMADLEQRYGQYSIQAQ